MSKETLISRKSNLAKMTTRIEGKSLAYAVGFWSALINTLGGIIYFLVMLGLEMMGWGWFLGLALLMAAPIFSIGKLQAWIKWLMVLYAILGIISAAGYLAASLKRL